MNNNNNTTDVHIDVSWDIILIQYPTSVNFVTTNIF